MFDWFRSKKPTPVALPACDDVLIVAISDTEVSALKGFHNTSTAMRSLIMQMQPKLITLLNDKLVGKYLPNLSWFNRYLVTAVKDTPSIVDQLSSQFYVNPIRNNNIVDAFYAFQVMTSEDEDKNHVNRVLAVFDETLLKTPVVNPYSNTPVHAVDSAVTHLCITYGLRWVFTQRVSHARVIAVLTPISPTFTLSEHCEFMTTMAVKSKNDKV